MTDPRHWQRLAALLLAVLLAAMTPVTVFAEAQPQAVVLTGEELAALTGEPAEQPAEQADDAGETPVTDQTPGEIPDETPDEASDEVPDWTPGEISGEISDQTPDEIPDETSEDPAPAEDGDPDALPADDEVLQGNTQEVSDYPEPLLAAVASGSCGTGLTWSLDSDGVLTISGSGDMYDYTGNAGDLVPWFDPAYIGKNTDPATVISEIVIEEGVTRIGTQAFRGCYNTALTSVTIPASVISIGDYAFYDCANLDTVTFADGSSLVGIGKQAFAVCPELSSVSQIPAGVTSIGEGAFASCGKLTELTVAAANECYKAVDGVLFLKDVDLLICYPAGKADTTYQVPGSVPAIVAYAFDGCTKLTSVTLPVGLSVIGDFAFEGCTGLTTIGLPTSLSAIGDNAFFYCNNLKMVNYGGMKPDWNKVIVGAGNTCLTKATFNYGTEYRGAGECGRNLIWTLNDEGVLTISGSGAMDNYSQTSPAPWDAKRGEIRTVVIEPGVTSIGDHAFAMCEELISVSIPAGVTKIGAAAFRQCNKLGDGLTVAEGNTAYGTYVNSTDHYALLYKKLSGGNKELVYFSSCPETYNVCILPQGLRFTAIGDEAFRDCSVLRGVTIPEGVTTIGKRAFNGCTGMTEISLPSTFKTVPKSGTNEYAFPFLSCGSLQSITVAAGNTAFYSVNGVLYRITSGKAELFCLPANNASLQDDKFVVPDKVNGCPVTAIGECALTDRADLAQIEIPESVTTIGKGAFSGCTALTTVYYHGNQTKWGKIARGAGNDPLTGAQLKCGDAGSCGSGVTWKLDPYGVLTISGSGAMANYHENGDSPWMKGKTNHLVTKIVIQEGVTSIGDYAFYNFVNEAMEPLVIPNSVTSIGEGAFWNSKVPSVTFSSGSCLERIGLGAFLSCFNLTEFTIPASVTRIDDAAFSGCTRLDLAIAPKNPAYRLDEHGALLTRDGTALLYYPANTPSGAYTVPDTVTRIGIRAFEICRNLTGITLPRGVKTIGNYAFYLCSNMTSATLPSTLTEIGNYAFQQSGLTGVVIPDSVTKIGYGAFYNCQQLQSVMLPGGLKKLESHTFAYCTALTGVTIPDGVTEIGPEAFKACTDLTGVTIPVSVKKIGKDTFAGCTGLSNVWYNGTEAQWKKISIGAGNECLTGLTPAHAPVWPDISVGGSCGDGLTWTLDENGVLTISGSGAMNDYAANAAPWFDPANIGTGDRSTVITQINIGEGITHIGKWAFRGCYNTALTGVAIPASVTSIGDGAFYDCSGLTKVTFASGSRLAAIGAQAFYGCRNLSSLPQIPAGVTAIGSGAFGGCEALTAMTLEAANVSYKVIDGVLFSNDGATLLCYPAGKTGTWYQVPRNVTAIEAYAFAGCKKLQTIDLPVALRAIGDSAFEYCEGLKSIDLPTGLTSIGKYAFCFCTRLTSVEIPNGITALSEGVFHSCSSLEEVTIPRSVQSIGNSAFMGCGSLTRVYYGGTSAQWNALKKKTGSGNDSLTNIIPVTDWDWPTISVDGVCGDDLTWTLDWDGTLTISGSGAMYNYSYPMAAPWAAYRADITRIVIGKDVTTIGSGAFANDNHWYAYDKLTEVVFESPSRLTTIGPNAFQGSRVLTQIDLPQSLTTIGSGAFYHCGLATVVAIPDGVTSIGYEAFCECTSLPEFWVDSDNTAYCSDSEGVLFQKKAGNTLELLCCPADKTGSYWIPQQVDGLSVTSIADEAFWFCYRLTKIVVPEGVTRIGAEAFWKCRSLQTVELPATVASIGFTESGKYGFPFESCNSLSSINVEEGNPNYCGVDGVLYRIADNKATLVCFPCCKQLTAAGAYIIQPNVPDENGSPVTAIGAKAFYYLSTLKTVEIPATVTVIDYNAFYSCSALKTVDFKGTRSQWNAIVKADGNHPLDLANIKTAAAPAPACQITVEDVPDQMYTGSALKPEVTVTAADGTELVAGVDYTVSYKNNTNAYPMKEGNKEFNSKKAPTVTITGKGNYSGTTTKYFVILPMNLGNATAPRMVLTTTGKDQDVKPAVTYNGKTLALGTKAKPKDFYVSAVKDLDANKDLEGTKVNAAGHYQVTLEGQGNYTATKTVLLDVIDPKDPNAKLISKATVTVGNMDYGSGGAKKPTVTVQIGKDILTEGTHYTVTYENNIYPGTARVIVQGNPDGDCYGSKTATFKINGVAIGGASVTIQSKDFTNQPVTLTEDDLTVILNKGKPNQEELKLTGSATENGYQIVPGSYVNNTNQGTAKVTIKGTGKYTGTKTVSFKILKASDNDRVTVSFDPAMPYQKGGVRYDTGNAAQFSITYDFGVGEPVALKEGVDYTLSYKNNAKVYQDGSFAQKNPPTATITFKGNYNLTKKTVNFTITPQDLGTVAITAADKAVAANASKPAQFQSAPVLTDANGKKLAAGTDYEKTVQYYICERSDPNDPGQMTPMTNSSLPKTGDMICVKAQGKGNYRNYTYAVAYYRIVAAGYDISKAGVALTDTVTQNAIYAQGRPVTLDESDLTVTMGSGKTKVLLRPGTDYEIVSDSYVNNGKKGNATVTIRGIGRYGGAKTVKFTIKAQPLKLA